MGDGSCGRLVDDLALTRPRCARPVAHDPPTRALDKLRLPTTHLHNPSGCTQGPQPLRLLTLCMSSRPAWLASHSARRRPLMRYGVTARGLMLTVA